MQLDHKLGASALLYRAKLRWQEQDKLPESLVLKFASANAEYRQYAKDMGTYLKEVRFYQVFGTDRSLPIPRTYFAEINEETGDFLIVMEDLTEARMVPWFAEGVDEVVIALKALAKIHARYWNDEQLNTLGWLGRSDDQQQSRAYQNLLQQLLAPAKAKFSSLLSDYSWAVLDAWLVNWESVRQATGSGRMTLVHREADMRQMFFPTPQLDRFVLFDWQSPEVGWGAMDACRMITTSLSLGARREHEHALVEEYMREIHKRGIHDLSIETLWHQIKLSLLMNVLAHMFSLLWVEKEETAVWQYQHLSTLGAAMEDWQLLELVQ